MQDIAQWCAWHRKNCRLSGGAILVYLVPVLLFLFATTESEYFGTPSTTWFIITSALGVASIGFGIWLSKPILRRCLAIVYVCTWMIAPVALSPSKDAVESILWFGAGCFWLTCYLDGQEAIKKVGRLHRDRE